ncbi:hypothetical protein EV426DRAFT_616050 [Tirmania nivea]|nr:hypothetical protein EV426DRAFT_616050 [Tirmania nivea]
MPRKSQRKFLIEWFLEGIEKDKYHLQAESFQSFLQRHRERVRSRIREVVEAGSGDAGEAEDSSVSLSLSVSLSSGSDSSLFSSDLKSNRVDWEANMRIKIGILQKILARRYLCPRGGEHRMPKLRNFREDIIARLPVDRFRHFFRMNLDSFMRVFARIENHEVFANMSNCP